MDAAPAGTRAKSFLYDVRVPSKQYEASLLYYAENDTNMGMHIGKNVYTLYYFDAEMNRTLRVALVERTGPETSSHAGRPRIKKTLGQMSISAEQATQLHRLIHLDAEHRRKKQDYVAHHRIVFNPKCTKPIRRADICVERLLMARMEDSKRRLDRAIEELCPLFYGMVYVLCY